MNFTEITKLMHEMYTKTKQLPVAIKVNEQWYERQMQQQFILRKPNENPLETFTGLKVQFDNTIDTFEFVYEK
jgi:hypothetical protein